jgi:hypothetical protein
LEDERLSEEGVFNTCGTGNIICDGRAYDCTIDQRQVTIPRQSRGL